MKKEPEKIYWTEEMVAKILHNRYPSPEWAFLTTVRNQTGFSRTVRTADAIAMNLFPSRGMAVEGFEIKVSRSDWLNELKDPHKSEELQQFCHHWWIVVPDRNFIHEGELPISWGLIEVGKKCKVIKAAPTLKAKLFTREFIASLFRNVCESFVHPQDVAQKVEQAKELARWSMNEGYRDYERLKEQVQDFEKESGLKISDRWGDKPKEIGKVVKLLLQEKQQINYRAKESFRYINDISEHFKNLLKHLEVEID